MGSLKTTTSLTIDADLMEFVRVKRMEDPQFNFSELINSFLRNYFGDEVKIGDERKVKANVSRLERELALEKEKIQQIKREGDRLKRKKEEKLGKEFDPNTQTYI